MDTDTCGHRCGFPLYFLCCDGAGQGDVLLQTASGCHRRRAGRPHKRRHNHGVKGHSVREGLHSLVLLTGSETRYRYACSFYDYCESMCVCVCVCVCARTRGGGALNEAEECEEKRGMGEVGGKECVSLKK